MERFRVELQHRAKRDFAALPESVRRRFYAVFENLAVNPFRARSGCDVRRLKGQQGAFAVRVGSDRATFEIVGDTIWFVSFLPRRVSYR